MGDPWIDRFDFRLLNQPADIEFGLTGFLAGSGNGLSAARFSHPAEANDKNKAKRPTLFCASHLFLFLLLL
jgi:hypothetical protein